jgi:hypothetical protein
MGQHDGRGSLTAPVTGSRDSPDLIFTLETGGHAPDRWRVTINTPAARDWCATFSNGCFDTHIAHAKVGSVATRAAAAGLFVRCE